MKPPGDNSFDTMQEVKELNKIPLNKKYVKDYDNIEAAFKKTADENGVKNYDKKFRQEILTTFCSEVCPSLSTTVAVNFCTLPEAINSL